MSSNQSQTRNKVAVAVMGRRIGVTTGQQLPLGIVGSVLFHGLILVAMIFTFQRNFTTPEETHVVPVDLVTIAEKTNVAAQAPPVPEPEKVIDRPPPVLEPPPEPQLQEVAPALEPQMPKFDIAKEKPPTRKQMTQDFNALLNKLTTPDKPVKTAKAGPRVIQGVGMSNLMTADLESLLQSQISRCWSPNVAIPNPQDAIVEFNVTLNPDGTVARLAMTPGTAAAAAINGYTRAASEAASRAIYQCQPYRLPADRYDSWREITPFTFDPRVMAGH